ncbi:MAG: SprT family zinc-dependent metalloprotease [Campylobacterota bacterium]|nr:SprT family zinc-dependent metalloprotease [Campylobacterota bacterium]
MTPLLPSFTHIINPKLKYIYLSFDQGGNLTIKSPEVSQREIEKVLIKKAAWIVKSRQRLLEKKGKPLKFEEGEELFFLGEGYPTRYEQSSKRRNSLHFDEQEGFIFSYYGFSPEKFEHLINQFYKQEAQRLIPEMTEKYARRMELFPTKISFRKARSRWGSCNSSNAISFNYLMMKLPLSVIQYIIVHELSHIKHKHHQKEFWKLVGIHFPDYKEQQNELKRYM